MDLSYNISQKPALLDTYIALFFSIQRFCSFSFIPLSFSLIWYLGTSLYNHEKNLNFTTSVIKVGCTKCITEVVHAAFMYLLKIAGAIRISTFRYYRNDHKSHSHIILKICCTSHFSLLNLSRALAKFTENFKMQQPKKSTELYLVR